MKYIIAGKTGEIARVTLTNGKVNAINSEAVSELRGHFASLEKDESVRSVILTGEGKFFSFGFHVPELYDYSPEEFTRFLQSFCQMYKEIFLFPKPLIASINGHAVAGGYILALMADYRIMADNNAKIALNEVTFGAALFAGAVEMLRFAAGNKMAAELLLTGQMFGAKEALRMGLVDQLVPEEEVLTAAKSKAEALGKNFGPNFAALKHLLRRPVADEWGRREESSITEFVKIWYSPETREKTRGIKIY